MCRRFAPLVVALSVSVFIPLALVNPVPDRGPWPDQPAGTELLVTAQAAQVVDGQLQHAIE